MVKDKRIYNPKMVRSDLEDPDGWTVENNPHPPDESMRTYPDSNGEHWADYFEWYDWNKKICHTCLKRAKYGSGNCQDNGEYFICVSSGRREKLRREYEKKRDVQSKLM